MERQTPKQLGFRMPAEWEPHSATWLTWPHNPYTWRDRMRAVQAAYAHMVCELAHGEAVKIIVDNEEVEATARAILQREGAVSPSIEFVRLATDSEWIRDYGPAFVVRDSPEEPLAIVDFGFNSWGAKYETTGADDLMPTRLGEMLEISCFDSDLILEGGAVTLNGEGVAITTEACLLRGNRNPELGRTEKENLIREYLGVDSVLWLGDGIAGDDTDGHVCDIARFINPHTVIAAIEENRTDPNNRALRDNMARLMRMYDRHGDRFHVATIPMPHPIYHDGERIPATYLNFYIGNEVILVPQFGCPQDRIALQVIDALGQGRRAVGIDARDLLAGLGSCHGLLLQQPKV
jgi:agmatine deiminase